MPTLSPTRSEVAIIVPCFNVEDHLPRALESVFSQTYQDFGVYAVDDNSTDETAQVLKNNADRCISVFQQHAGPAAARNRGIRMSESPFVAFLDADDEWLPHKLERQIAILKKNPDLGMVCSLCAVGSARNTDGAHLRVRDIPESGRLFQYLVRRCFVFTPTVVVRRQCLDEVGLFNESLPVSEDFNLWLRIAGRWDIAIVPEVLAITFERPGSLSVSTSPEERLRSGVSALKDVQSRCLGLSSVERRALRIALAERLYFYGSYLLSAGATRASRENFLSALKLQPSHWRAYAKLGLSFLPADAFGLLAELKRTNRL